VNALQTVNLTELMARTSGRPNVRVGLIDGPVFTQSEAFSATSIEMLTEAGACVLSDSIACIHGTFVAGILCAKRDSGAPAICPGCTLLVRPIFTETTGAPAKLPSAAPELLAAAIRDCVAAGAHVINLSLALAQPISRGREVLAEALDHALRQDVVVVAAAGNQGTLGSSVVTCHPWVIPVVSCDRSGRPTLESNLGHSIARRGLSALGHAVTSLGTGDQLVTLGGTSVAAPFVTGAIALLWSEFPQTSAAQMRLCISNNAKGRHGAVVPPLLDASAAYQALCALHGRGP
jgi:subtilisin family serine protease